MHRFFKIWFLGLRSTTYCLIYKSKHFDVKEIYFINKDNIYTYLCPSSLKPYRNNIVVDLIFFLVLWCSKPIWMSVVSFCILVHFYRRKRNTRIFFFFFNKSVYFQKQLPLSKKKIPHYFYEVYIMYRNVYCKIGLN